MKTITDTNGEIVESDTWDNTKGVKRTHELVICSFIIPEGPFAGFTAAFVGFFVP